uniref:TF-B3 domain-containing protein n=1 Tax=Cannabis sativa TaxID=3483 RepID=A0A803PF48_CANSA
MAATEAIKEALWLKGFTSELELNPDDITMHCDNQSELHLMKNPTHHERSKHINIKLHFIRDIITSNQCIPKNLWDVNLASNGGGLVLCGGWSRFARENNLQPGHSCVFELVTKETHTDNSALLNVTISRPIYNAAVI